MKKIIIGVVLCLVVVYGYSKFRYVDFVDVGIFCSVWVVFEFVMVVFVCYSCDGCMYCLYMCLCEEVMYFIQNCFGMQMDGDNDGILCEQQWCG